MKNAIYLNLQLILLWLFLGVSIVKVSAQSSLLDQPVTIKLEGKTVLESLKLLENTISATFAYNNHFIPTHKLYLSFKEEKLSRVLDEILKKTILSYMERDGQIVIFPDPANNQKAKLKPVTISGYIRDSTSGEELIGSTIFVKGENTGTGTNPYGFYSLTLPEGQYTLIISHIGYQGKDTLLTINQKKELNIELAPAPFELLEIVVTANDKDSMSIKSEDDYLSIDMEDIKTMPAIFGSQDIMQGLQLLPGVLATGEASGGISVRGGSSDQNLILLDEAPIYNVSHLFGVFSIFNTDAVKNVRIYKGNIPAEFRGRLSSVVDIRMDEGNKRKFGVSGGIGLVAARLKLEGKLINDKGSFMVAGRRTYQDLVVKFFSGDPFNKNGLFYSDLNAKVNYQFGKRDRVFLSGYLGQDVLRLDDENGIQWGNQTATVRWNHLFNDRLFLNTSFVFNDYKFRSVTDLQKVFDTTIQDNLSIETRIRDYNIKGNFQFFQNPKSTFKFGWTTIYHTFVPARLFDNEALEIPDTANVRNGLELSLYGAHNWELNDKWKIDYGVHFSNLSVLGANTYVYDYDDRGNRSDSTFYGRGDLIQNYFRVEPRFSVNYYFDERSWINFGASRTYQYLQRISSSFANNPANVWIPSSQLIKPQRGDQVSLGYFRHFDVNQYEVSVEIFYKNMENQIDFRDGTFLGFAPKDIEPLLVFGRVRAMGAEFFFRKKFGRLRGWLSYTLSGSRAQFKDIDNGSPFPTDVDRTHDASIVGIYDISAKWTFAAKWVYYTGRPVTLPNGKYILDDQIIDYYARRNNFRLDDHHRLDISFTLYRKGNRQRGGSWNFAIYNLYARNNPVLAFVDNTTTNRAEVNQLSLFSFVPSVTYNFKF